MTSPHGMLTNCRDCMVRKYGGMALINLRLLRLHHSRLTRLSHIAQDSHCYRSYMGIWNLLRKVQKGGDLHSCALLSCAIDGAAGSAAATSSNPPVQIGPVRERRKPAGGGTSGSGGQSGGFAWAGPIVWHSKLPGRQIFP